MDERPGRGGQYAEDERARAENDQDRDRSDDIFRHDKSESGDMFMKIFKEYLRRVFRRERSPSPPPRIPSRKGRRSWPSS